LNKKFLKYSSFIVCLLVGAAACHNMGSGSSPLFSFTGSSDEEQPVNNATENMSVNDFMKWCADAENDLNKTKEISELKYNLSYIPTESMAYLELRTEEYDNAKLKKAMEHYADMTYFSFKIENQNGGGELLKHDLNSVQQYDWRVKYISFGMQNDIVLIQGGDTLSPGLYQFERIFEVAPYATVMFAFDNSKFNRDKEFTIVYTDKIFNKGIIKFHYKNQQLINVPNIVGL